MNDHHPAQESPTPLRPEAAAFVERLASELVEMGMQRMAARVFSCLMISEEPALTSAELAARLHVSPAAVSGAVRYLAQVHLISRERRPGSRRELYRLHHNIWYESLVGRDAVLRRWAQTMRDGMSLSPPDSLARERLAETAEFMTFLDKELTELLERWRQRREGLDES